MPAGVSGGAVDRVARQIEPAAADTKPRLDDAILAPSIICTRPVEVVCLIVLLMCCKVNAPRRYADDIVDARMEGIRVGSRTCRPSKVCSGPPLSVCVVLSCRSFVRSFVVLCCVSSRQVRCALPSSQRAGREEEEERGEERRRHHPRKNRHTTHNKEDDTQAQVVRATHQGALALCVAHSFVRADSIFRSCRPSCPVTHADVRLVVF
jgi:hypothetical protein